MEDRKKELRRDRLYFVRAMAMSDYLVDFDCIRADAQSVDRSIMTYGGLVCLCKAMQLKANEASAGKRASWKKKHPKRAYPGAWPTLTLREPQKGGQVYLCGDGFHFETFLVCEPVAKVGEDVAQIVFKGPIDAGK